MAKDLAENERTWEDYTRKSLPHFRIADITAGNADRKVMDPSRVKQFVQNFFGTSPPVCFCHSRVTVYTFLGT